jgi:hypothetical protein
LTWASLDKIVTLDRDKVLAILDLIHNCPFGIVCSVVDTLPKSEWLLRQSENARTSGDEWYAISADVQDRVGRPFSVCGRAFPRRERWSV